LRGLNRDSPTVAAASLYGFSNGELLRGSHRQRCRADNRQFAAMPLLSSPPPLECWDGVKLGEDLLAGHVARIGRSNGNLSVTCGLPRLRSSNECAAITASPGLPFRMTSTNVYRAPRC
jgi:hypothetical protein